MMLYGIAVFLSVLCVIAVCVDNLRGRDSRPPGPLRFPLFGNLFQIALEHKPAYIALDKLAKKYGDTMSIKLGVTEMVVVSSYQAIKSIFSLDATSHRHCSGFLLDRNLKQNGGLIFSNGPEHTELSKFCREALHLHTESRESRQHLMIIELNEFIKQLKEDLDSNPSGCIHVQPNFFDRVFLNVMYTTVIGGRLDYDHEEFQKLLRAHTNLSLTGATTLGIDFAFPFLPQTLLDLLGFNKLTEAFLVYHNAAKRQLFERAKEVEHDEPRSLLDKFVSKMHLEQGTIGTLYTDDNFAMVFSDILQAGTETTSSVVNFIILHLTFNQQIQDTLYREILSVVGHNRNVNLTDKPEMLYTQAVILEGLRWSRVATFGVPRKAKTSFHHNNYRIKKDTVLMFNLHSVFFDECIWGDPNVFRPERFINTEGQLDSKKQEILQYAFGAGKRRCFGIEIARASLFISTVTLVQNLKFMWQEGDKPCFEPEATFVLHPPPYNALVTLRSKS